MISKHLLQLVSLGCVALAGAAQIEPATDAPKRLTPEQSVKTFQLPPGFALKLLAAEPLITEPAGVCWDERGRLFVCELHGYNFEGHYDIEELNKTGKLDLTVRRIQASEAAKKRAEQDTYGTVKLLLDTDGDGCMDKAVVWADHLPPCYGLVPARGGLVIMCAPDIVFLQDTDGDGKPDVREVLFTGFKTGILERRSNDPQGGVDNWIYLGAGGGGTISGPHLKQPVVLGSTDFRIRADGSALEPVTGRTGTIGLTFTTSGDCFVPTMTTPAHFVLPIPWSYLQRNADAAAPLADAPAADYTQVFPRAPTHPWRTKREHHAEYFAFYKKISISDAVAAGYFTSTCSPLVYRDQALPGLSGQYLVCEPAQNLVHRALIEREGTRLRLKRPTGEEQSEFLASSDPWFHPIGLHQTPDGNVVVVDFYREIIEDYSAIPRHLQQQYGVIHGHDCGRLWLLTAAGAKPAAAPDLTALDDAALAAELASERFWRRQTARRLLIERGARKTVPALGELLRSATDAAAALGALYTLEGLGALTSDHLLAAWHHSSPDVRCHALRIADPVFDGIGRAVEKELLAGAAVVQDPQLLLQMALSLGQSQDARAIGVLIELARAHGDLRWMDAAIASSAAHRETTILNALATNSGQSQTVLVNLAGVIAGRGDAREIAAAIATLEAAKNAALEKPLDILQLGLEETKPPAAADSPTPPPTAPGSDQLAALEARLPNFVAALKDRPDIEAGRTLFQNICGMCHRSHGIGVGVGPDLDAEFQRAPEVILRDILFPNETIRAGFETVVARTRRGETIIGVAVSDSPTSVTLRLPSGIERTVLRKRAAISTARNVSLMLADFGEVLQPIQVANLIAFLRQPPAK